MTTICLFEKFSVARLCDSAHSLCCEFAACPSLQEVQEPAPWILTLFIGHVSHEVISADLYVPLAQGSENTA